MKSLPPIILVVLMTGYTAHSHSSSTKWAVALHGGAAVIERGRNELDAAIMDGATLKAGAVAAVTRTRHPITLARAVMEKSPHVMLAGNGADAFGAEQGIEQVDPTLFFTAGQMAWSFNTPGTYRASASSDSTPRIAIFKDER